MIGLSLGERRGSHACSATTTLFSHPSARASKSKRGGPICREIFTGRLWQRFSRSSPRSFVARPAGRRSVDGPVGRSVATRSPQLPSFLPSRFPPTVPLFRPSVLPPVIRQSIGVLPPFVLSLSLRSEHTSSLAVKQADRAMCRGGGHADDRPRATEERAGAARAGGPAAGGRGQQDMDRQEQEIRHSWDES